MGVVAPLAEHTGALRGGLLLECSDVADALLLPLDPRRKPRNKRPNDNVNFFIWKSYSAGTVSLNILCAYSYINITDDNVYLQCINVYMHRYRIADLATWWLIYLVSLESEDVVMPCWAGGLVPVRCRENSCGPGVTIYFLVIMIRS